VNTKMRPAPTLSILSHIILQRKLP
jgi:hypothetical protein